MQRRTLLRRSAVLGAIAMAGCTGDGDGDVDDGDETPTDGDTDAPTDEPTDASSGITGFAGRSIETTNTDCADEGSASATVTFDADGPSVGIEGVIEASDPCHAASFEGMKYDSEENVLSVTIAAKPEGTGEMCAQCLGGIEYTASADLEGGLPATVVVKHGTGSNTTEVARVDRE